MALIESLCAIFKHVCHYENKPVFLGNSYTPCGVNRSDLVANSIDLISFELVDIRSSLENFFR